MRILDRLISKKVAIQTEDSQQLKQHSILCSDYYGQYQSHLVQFHEQSCPECDIANLATARYCQQCGMALVASACFNCNQALSINAKFCTHCGQQQ